VVYFHPVTDIHIPECLPDSRVAYFINITNEFGYRVNYTVLVLEERRQVTTGNIAVFVYSSPKNGSAILSKPYRIISATTKE
jgi:hypothetical protein